MAIEAQNACANCGGKSFTRDDTPLGLAETNQGTVKLGGRVLPVIALACNDCGTIRLFSTKIAS